MTKYFWSAEEAALFAAWRRDQGYFAEVCDEAVARLWGPLAVGGCRVITSETKGEHRSEPPPAGPVELFLFWVARLWAFVALAGGAPTLVYHTLIATRDLGSRTILLGLGIVLLSLIGMLILSVCLSSLIAQWRLAMDGERSIAGELLVGLMAALGFLLALLVFSGAA